MSEFISVETNWYALYTKPRFEKRVYKQLLNQEVDVFLPLITTIRQWSDRKKKVQVPLMNSYVFVKCCPTSLNDFYVIPGVLNVVKHLRTPAIIQEFEIENLRILMNSTEEIGFLPLEGLTKGDTVVVEKGPFQNLIADCIKLNGKHRIIVRFSGLDNGIELNIPISYVKKIN